MTGSGAAFVNLMQRWDRLNNWAPEVLSEISVEANFEAELSCRMGLFPKCKYYYGTRWVKHELKN